MNKIGEGRQKTQIKTCAPRINALLHQLQKKKKASCAGYISFAPPEPFSIFLHSVLCPQKAILNRL